MALQSISKIITGNPVNNGRLVTAVQKNGAYQTGPAESTVTNFKAAPVGTNDFSALNVRMNTRFDDPTYYG